MYIPFRFPFLKTLNILIQNLYILLHSFTMALYNPVMRFKTTLFETQFGDLFINLGVSRRFQLAIYTVFHEKSKSEVQHIQILVENLKTLISTFQTL